MPNNGTPPEVSSFGKRVQRHQTRNGLTREVLGGLVGRSAEWVKAIETGRLQVPRLPLLLRLAEVLQVKDLADLTGEHRLSATTVTREAHEKLPAIRTALTTYHLTTSDTEPLPSQQVADRVRHGWQLWQSWGEPEVSDFGLTVDLLGGPSPRARGAAVYGPGTEPSPGSSPVCAVPPVPAA